MEKESTITSIISEINTIKNKKDSLILDVLGFSDWNDKMGTYFFEIGKDDRSPYFAVSFNDLTERLSYLSYDPRLEILMELRDKYSTITLGEILIKPINRGVQPEYVEDGEVRVIKTVDLKNDFIDYENCLRTSKQFAENSPDAKVERRDILVASTGYMSMGKIDIYDLEEPAIADGHISILRIINEYDPNYIASYLRSHLGKIQFERWWNGSSGQIELQPTDLEKFIIPDGAEWRILINRDPSLKPKTNEQQTTQKK